MALAGEAGRALLGLNSTTAAAAFQSFLACAEAKLSVMPAMKLCMHMLQGRVQVQVLIYESGWIIPSPCPNISFKYFKIDAISLSYFSPYL